MFAKSERGYRLTEKNKRFWSLLILLFSVASIRRKLWRTQCPYKFRKIQHSTRIVKYQFNSKKIIQILQPTEINYFSTHSYIVNISKYFGPLKKKKIFRWRWILKHSWKIWKCRLHHQRSSKKKKMFLKVTIRS